MLGGLFLQNSGEFELAMADYQRTIDENPRHYSAYYNAGSILAMNGNIAKALEHFKLTVQFKNDHAKAYKPYCSVFMNSWARMKQQQRPTSTVYRSTPTINWPKRDWPD